MYLTQGIDAKKESKFNAGRIDPANASRYLDQDQVDQNDKSVPIIKGGFLYIIGEPTVKTLETRFAGARLNTKSVHNNITKC